MELSTVKCPSCGHEFPITEIIKSEIEREKAGLREQYIKEKEKINKLKEDLEKQKSTLKIQLEEELAKRNKEWQEQQLNLLKNQAQTEVETLKKILSENEKIISEAKKKELELMQIQRELKETKENMEVEIAKRKLAWQEEIEKNIKSKAEEEYQLKIKEMELTMESQKKLIDELKKKAEQGSMQLQGEAMEMVLEDVLKSSFPIDTISEVPKGVRGADCIQTVKNALGHECGKIVYESKRTKNFANDWIDKLKDDARALGTDIAVLVTEVLPKDMNHFGFVNGIWICRFRDLVPLAFALRDRLIHVHEALKSSENKGEKMNMLYNYLTGNEFRQQIEAITEGFMKLKEGITKERAMMEKHWKEREKQIEKIFLNTTHMYGSIKAIAGNAVGSVKYLDEDSDEENKNLLTD
jgi:hypothetical protein